jgi:Cu(I)/Ag(I) efflux system membrane fusion protein
MIRLLSLVLVAALAPATPAARDVKTGVVDPYLRIQTALAADTIVGVSQDAAAIAAAAAALGPSGAKLRAAASELQRAGDVSAARAGFWKLSDALIAYARETKISLGAGVRTAYCPMEKKSWAQKDGQIANPYAGKKMLRCGEFTSPPGS